MDAGALQKRQFEGELWHREPTRGRFVAREYASVGGQFVVLMFTVVVLGGLGNVAGAVLGGIGVGVIQSLSGLFFPIQLQNLVLFVVFIAVLAFRPEGLLRGAA